MAIKPRDYLEPKDTLAYSKALNNQGRSSKEIADDLAKQDFEKFLGDLKTEVEPTKHFTQRTVEQEEAENVDIFKTANFPKDIDKEIVKTFPDFMATSELNETYPDGKIPKEDRIEISKSTAQQDVMDEPDWMADIDIDAIDALDEFNKMEALKQISTPKLLYAIKLAQVFELSDTQKQESNAQEFIYELMKLCEKYKVFVNRKQTESVNFTSKKSSYLQITMSFIKKTTEEEIESFDDSKVIL